MVLMWTLKPAKSHSLAILSFTVRLRDVILALGTSKWVSASAYERWPLTGGASVRGGSNMRPFLLNKEGIE